MKPILLELSAWGSYPGEVKIDFESFDEEGIFLITGPTGAGKTTIFDAISFALYGNVSGSVREKTSLRSDFAKPEAATFVELIFKHKGRNYKIRRVPKYERPKKRQSGTTTQNETAEFYCLDEPERQPITKLADVNGAVYELMGIDYNQFKQIAMIAQGEFQKLLIADSEERVKILRKLFRTDHFERIAKMLTEQTLALYKKRATETTKIDSNLLNLRVKSEELNAMITAEDKDYEAILPLVKEEIKEDVKELKEQTKLRKEALEAKEAVNLRIESVKEQLEKKKQLSLCKEKLIRLEGKAESIKGQEEKIECIRNAKEVLPYASRFHAMEQEEKKARVRCETIKEQLLKVKKSLEDSKDNLLKIAGLKEKNETLAKEKAYLEPFEQLLKKESSLADEYEKAAKEYQQLKTMNDQMAAYLTESKENIKKQKDELQAYAGIEQKAADHTVAIEKHKQMMAAFDEEKNRQNRLREEKNKLSDWEKQRNVQKDTCTKKKEEINEANLNLTRAQAGILAQALAAGEACPVCGSTSHPQLAHVPESVLTEDEIKELEAIHTKETDKLSKMDRYVASQEQLVKSLEEQSQVFLDQYKIQEDGFMDTYGAYSQELGTLEQTLKSEKEQLAKKGHLEAALQKLQENIAQYEKEKEEKDKQLESLRTKTDDLKGRLAAMKETIPEQYNTLSVLTERLAAIANEMAKNRTEEEKLTMEQEFLNKQKQELEGSEKEANVTIKTLGEQLLSMNQELKQVLADHKFADFAQYEQTIAQAAALAGMEAEVAEFKEDKIRTLQLKEALEKDIKEEDIISLEELEEKRTSMTEALARMDEWIQEHTTGIDVNKDILGKIEKTLDQLSSLNDKYRIYMDLDNAAKGFNGDRIKLEQFVLSVYFKEILKAANIRLATMTGGRYELLKAEKVEDARKRGSLEIEVLDYYTGKRRSVKTLSGGESFKAAICLALGLSDIVQNNAGGIEIETLFIDEGFGALDAESLEQALETLGSLSANNRLIGIISHVSELKERIDHQIVVSRTQQGSKVEIR